MKVWVSRTDRLGDVIMALPALNYLREALPTAEIDFYCAEPFRKLLQPFLAARRIRLATTDDLTGYSAGLFLNTDSRLLFRAWFRQMRIRVGVLSRWHSFLWLNSGVRQRRSSAEKNEGQYSLELAQRLVELLLGRKTVTKTEYRVVLDSDPVDEAAAAGRLKLLGVKGAFIVLHPGTGGTAINVAAKDFVEIARSLEATGLPVVLSQGPSPLDAELVSYLIKHYRKLPVIEGVGLEVLREIFRKARAVVGPSTGPLHLAHAVGTESVGLFAPIRAQSPARWGFWGGKGKSTILVPELDCPGVSRCIGPSCKEYFCMEKMPWGRLILKWANGLKGES